MLDGCSVLRPVRIVCQPLNLSSGKGQMVAWTAANITYNKILLQLHFLRGLSLCYLSLILMLTISCELVEFNSL